MERVEFNAHRVFAPASISDEAKRTGFALMEFYYLLENQGIERSVSVDADFKRLARSNYALGIFHFKKL